MYTRVHLTGHRDLSLSSDGGKILHKDLMTNGCKTCPPLARETFGTNSILGLKAPSGCSMHNKKYYSSSDNNMVKPSLSLSLGTMWLVLRLIGCSGKGREFSLFFPGKF